VEPAGGFDGEAAERAAREAKERADRLQAKEITATSGF
jgi:hypothetical protein